MAKKEAPALVPEEEQPYPVPENWCWVNVGALIDLYRGVSYKKNDAHSERLDGDYLIMRGGNILEGAINTDADNVYVNRRLVQEEQLVKKYDIIIVSSTGSSKVIGRAGISHNDYNDVAFGAFLLLARPNKLAVKPFVNFFFQSELYRDRIRLLANGVNINNIRTDHITSMPIPFPPISEQHRIVARIESLFAKLDEAKEKLQAVVDGYEIRRAAILHRAFAGELTAKWRKEHSVGMESWGFSELGDCADTQYGYTESASQEKVGPKFLRITDIQNGVVNWSEIPYCKISEEGFYKYAIHPDNIMVARTGATTGKSYLVLDDIDAVFASYLIRITIKASNLLPTYLYNFMQSQHYWDQIIEFSVGIAQPGVNAKKLKKITLPIPLIEEQKQIIKLLTNLLDQEQQVQCTAEAALAKIDLIKKSILARAFRGELGTNDPEEARAELPAEAQG